MIILRSWGKKQRNRLMIEERGESSMTSFMGNTLTYLYAEWKLPERVI
jgi:hypothetical protein